MDAGRGASATIVSASPISGARPSRPWTWFVQTSAPTSGAAWALARYGPDPQAIVRHDQMVARILWCPVVNCPVTKSNLMDDSRKPPHLELIHFNHFSLSLRRSTYEA